MKPLSKNVFRDYGIANADEEKAKIDAVALILEGLRQRDWRPADLARAADMPPANISEILNLKLDRYSIDRLNRVLAVFGKRIAVEYRVVENV